MEKNSGDRVESERSATNLRTEAELASITSRASGR
jgi:hypothetical protein